MSYKVVFETLAIIGEDEKTGKQKIGNIAQGLQTVYTDLTTEAIERAINADLSAKKLVAVIKSIEYVTGKCLN